VIIVNTGLDGWGEGGFARERSCGGRGPCRAAGRGSQDRVSFRMRWLLGLNRLWAVWGVVTGTFGAKRLMRQWSFGEKAITRPPTKTSSSQWIC